MTAPEPLAWLDALADTHSKATEGPWEHIVDDHGRKGIEHSLWSESADGYVAEQLVSHYAAADAAAIVAEHNALPELLRLARERYALEAAVLALAEELDDKRTPRSFHSAGTFSDGTSRAYGNAAADIRSTVTAALAGPHTADEEADRG
ncbi:MAG: hypothetical protein JWM36_4887 [Hyphomicrobiales bacterium]|nr:hypothetical protein [Hyphomicrobiales bacterium]